LGIFCFIDEIAEVNINKSITAYFNLKGDEEFLQDHFDGFPVMPGVLLLESLRQAASALLTLSRDYREPFYRLFGVENVKFGQFVRPGSRLKVGVSLLKEENHTAFFEGRIDLMGQNGNHQKALSAGLALVPVECSVGEKAALAINSRLMHDPLRARG
jgi:3-hydroxyacyl-[acyl-carrier-protein] dehydratase